VGGSGDGVVSARQYSFVQYSTALSREVHYSTLYCTLRAVRGAARTGGRALGCGAKEDGHGRSWRKRAGKRKRCLQFWECPPGCILYSTVSQYVRNRWRMRGWYCHFVQ